MYLDIREEDVSTASLTTRRLEQNRVEACCVGISRMRRKSRVEKHRPRRKQHVPCYVIQNEHNQNNFEHNAKKCEHNAVFWGKFGIE